MGRRPAGGQRTFHRTLARVGRRADGSLHSLDAVREWRDLVARAQQDDGTTATSPLTALPTSSWSRFAHAPPAVARPTPAARQLTEDLAAYLGHVLQRHVPTAAWELAETSSGFEPAVRGLPAGTALVVKRSLDLLAAALQPLTPEQEQLFRRYNPIRADVDRWLEGAPPPGHRRGGGLGRLRPG